MKEELNRKEKPKYKLSFFAQPSQPGTFGEKVDNAVKSFGKFIDKIFSPSTYFNFFKKLFQHKK